MVDLEKLFKNVVKSNWDEIPFDFSQEDLEKMRQAEWYRERFLEAVGDEEFNQGLLAIIGNAMSPLYSFEKVFLMHKLHFGNIVEQEGAVEALECLEDTKYGLITLWELKSLLEGVTIENDYVERKLNKIREQVNLS